MKKIALTRGKYALVDDEDYAFLIQWKWYCNAQGYAARQARVAESPDKVRFFRMHRIILDAPQDKEVDHINRNPLDNRKQNLRLVTHRQNILNTGLYKHNRSGIKGVSWCKATNSWRAAIQAHRKSIHLGVFKDFKDALKARKLAEKQYHAI